MYFEGDGCGVVCDCGVVCGDFELLIVEGVVEFGWIGCEYGVG